MKRRFVCLLAALVAAVAQTMVVFAADESGMAESAVSQNSDLRITDTVAGTLVEPRYEDLFGMVPGFVIKGKTATCELIADSTNKNEPMEANIVLYRNSGTGKEIIDVWTIIEYDRINWKEIVELPQAGKYTLSIVLTSGPDRYTKDISRTC